MEVKWGKDPKNQIYKQRMGKNYEAADANHCPFHAYMYIENTRNLILT